MEGVESLNPKKSRLEERRFYAGVIFGCSIIFLLGYGSAFLNFKDDFCKDDACKKQNEILKIVAAIPVVLGVGASSGLMFWIKLYFDGQENKLELEAIKEKHELELKVIKRRHELEREVPSEYRYSAEMDFLSVYYQKNGDVPDSSYEDFCHQIRGFCDSRGGIREKTKIYLEQHHRETIEEVLEGLKKGFREDENGVAPFYKLAKEACNHALKLKDLGKTEEWARPFYDDIRLYLYAWLWCSIRHGFAIPIRPFVLHLDEGENLHRESTERCLGKEARGHYFAEDSYIEAIEYIQNPILEHVAIIPFFGTQEARNMVKGYLEKLVQLLKDEKLERASQDEYLSYIREATDSF